MTDEELLAIRTRAKHVGDDVWEIPDSDLNGHIWAIGPIEGYDGDALGLETGSRIAEFVSHAPADVHALLTEVERLRAENAAMREIVQAVAGVDDAAIAEACPHCKAEQGYAVLTHTPSCLVTKARALLGIE